MPLFYIYSFTFEFLFFSLLILLLLHYTGIATTSLWYKIKQNQTTLNIIKILIYCIEIFFIILIIKLYWWTLYDFIYNYLQLYVVQIEYLQQFCKLLFYSWLYTTVYSLCLIYSVVKIFLHINLKFFQLTFLTKIFSYLTIINILNLFNISIISLLIFWFHSINICNWLIFNFNWKILLWFKFYNILPIFNTTFFINNYQLNNNLYHYNLFDYSYFSFYNKYIILLFLCLYYLIIYTYYKISLFSNNANKLNFTKFNYLFSYEYPILLGFLYLGYILVISTNNLFIVYLGFEIQTFTILILSGQIRFIYSISLTNLKYFFYSFFSSLTFLLSLLYLYNFTNTVNYYEIYLYLIYNWELNINNIFIYLGFFLLILSFLFKLGVFPFYIWVLDIFEGFPRLITLLLLTLNKFNLYIFLVKFLTIITTFNLFLFNWLMHILTVASLFSLFIGSLLALTQTNIHRFFGATSITHMGLLLLLIKILLINNNINTYYIIYSYFSLLYATNFNFF